MRALILLTFDLEKQIIIEIDLLDYVLGEVLS